MPDIMESLWGTASRTFLISAFSAIISVCTIANYHVSNRAGFNI